MTNANVITLTSETNTFGWNISLNTNEPSTQPIITGTVKHVLSEIEKNEAYQEFKHLPHTLTWFIDGQPIKTVDHNGNKGMWNFEWIVQNPTTCTMLIEV